MNSKSVVKSRTVWGAVLTGLLGLFAVLGVDFAEGEADQLAQAIGIVITTCFTLYGRLKANDRINRLF